MNKNEIKTKYEELYPLYERLGKNVKDALIQFLEDSKIDYHDVEFRIKDFDSFYKKIERKNYKEPFKEIEDICGIRIINYYPSDLNKITELIKQEFNVTESIDKQDELDDDRFGYRSYHYIANLKKEWLKAPNYRGLEKLNFEIQARTILMHGWAAINHKLLYKHEQDVPKEFKRDLFRLSALIELADEQFERLRNEKEKYAKETVKKIENGRLIISKEQSLNIDSLQALLNFYFPKRGQSKDLSGLINEITEQGLSLEELNKNILSVLKDLNNMEKEMEENYKKTEDIEVNLNWAQEGAIRLVLSLTVKKYFNEGLIPPKAVCMIVEKYKKWK